MLITDPSRPRTAGFLRLTGVAGLTATLVLTAAACGGRDDEPTSEAPAPAPSSPTSTAASPSETPTAAPSASASGTPLPSPATLTDRLLGTEQVPGLNATWKWQDGETGPAGADAFGLCAKVDLASIGATEVVERTYFPPVDTDDSAAEQLATFPDAKSTAQANAVLKSWHARCKAFLDRPGAKVGAITPVRTDTGTGSWYLVSYPEGNDEGRFHAFGVVTSGTTIAVLRIDNGGQDYNYPAGQEPMVGMVRAAASRLG